SGAWPMTGIVDWAAARARMVIAFIALSLLAGTLAYVSLPKEGEPASSESAINAMTIRARAAAQCQPSLGRLT
ncbi:MAG: hypothetical protein R6V38_12215, partial [Roseovarius gahaiensis]